MKNPLDMKHQRGAVSLFWCVVLFAVVALVMMAGLLSFRDNRNLFAEAWEVVSAQSAQAGGKIEKKLKAVSEPAGADSASASAPPAGEIRKCVVNGKVLYSNVECGADDKSSRKVDVRPSEGLSLAPPPAAGKAAK